MLHRKRTSSRRTLLAGSAALAATAAIDSKHITPALAQNATPVGIPGPIVQTTTGPITGLIDTDVTAYKGIPYATPPLDTFRWVAPQEITPWTDPLAANDFCSDCMQVVGPEALQTTPSEDCLGINIWQPTGAAPDAALPVLLWIHGGGYVAGGSSIPWYDGTPFARQGLVVVSFNYRLGRFGFFIPSALEKNTDPPYGNYGYLDQITVLHWVQNNIAAFGGDPTRVTLVGESAGGASVIHLITSPAVEAGLFHQAVILSGGGREALLDRPWTPQHSFEMTASEVDTLFATSVGIIGHGQKQLDKLRAVPAEKLVGDLDLVQLLKTRLFGGTFAGVPVVDGEIVQGQPQDHFLDSTAKQLPVIIGSTGTDIPTHFPPSLVHPLAWFGPDEKAAKDAYGFGDDRSLGISQHLELLQEIGVDLTMHEPAHFIASTMQQAGHPSWVYRFTYTAESTRPEHLSQIHSGELPFLFDHLAARYGDAVTANDQNTATAFNTYISNFVKTGDPNGNDLPQWPAITPGEFDVMNFTLDDGPVFGPDPRPTVALVATARERHKGEDLP